MAKTSAIPATGYVDPHYETATCTKEHEGIPVKRLGNLHTRQAGPLRHRCPACAYEMGKRDGMRQALEEIKRKQDAGEAMS